MSFVANRLKAIKPSPTLAVTAKAARLKSEGKDVISVGAGAPDLNTPPHIKDAAVEAMKKGMTKYTAAGGTPSLRKAIVAKFKRENGLDYTEKQILVSCGGKQTSFNLCLALLNAGDEAIIPAPYWVSYPDMAQMADAKPVFIQTGIEQGFKITPVQLKNAITPKSRLLWLNSPSNPPGSVYTAPVGFDGLLIQMRRERGVIARSSCCAVILKPCSMPAWTNTGIASAIIAMSGYETQKGAGMIASSPELSSAMHRLNDVCLPPQETRICLSL